MWLILFVSNILITLDCLWEGRNLRCPGFGKIHVRNFTGMYCSNSSWKSICLLFCYSVAINLTQIWSSTIIPNKLTALVHIPKIISLPKPGDQPSTTSHIPLHIFQMITHKQKLKTKQPFHWIHVYCISILYQ